MKKVLIVIITIAAVLALGYVTIAASEKRTEKVMSIHYCFHEAMNGTLEHYECEK